MTEYPWGIQHIPTGKLLPCRMFRTSPKGSSTWEPWNSAQKPYDPLPRLFATKNQAQRSLAQILRGKPVWETVGYSAGDVPEERQKWYKTPHHNPADYRVVPFTLTLRKD